MILVKRRKQETMSKKEKAFELFRQGKKPSDPEPRALGLKSKTVYAYYEDFKRQEYGKPVELTAIDDDEIVDLKKEKVKVSLTSQIDELKAKQERLPERIERLEKRLDALIEYLEDLLPRLYDLAYTGPAIAIDHYVQGHSVSREYVENWPPTQDFSKAVESLERLGPIPEKLRKLLKGD
jgi:hypothetical protein